MWDIRIFWITKIESKKTRPKNNIAPAILRRDWNMLAIIYRLTRVAATFS